jgi:hypothetical protein
MIQRNSLFLAISACACLTLFALACPLSARTLKRVSSSGKASSSQSVSGTQDDTHFRLYQKLCELNENWRNRTPNFGILADIDSIDDDVSLIQTHLKLVISQLRSADVGHLSDSQLAQRLAHLQSLQAYMADGNFPQNVIAVGRRPVFIDPWGTHCAVGHLMATSGHSQLANTINREHQLDLLRDIKTDGLAEWQHGSGLSADELALIQPTYRSTTLKYPEEIEELILGNSEALRASLETGELKVDARCGGKTLLHFASAAGDLPLVKLLVEKGGDLQAVSTLGCDRADLAKGGSQKVMTVRWNQFTSVTGRGGLGIGVSGPVFKTQHGQFVAGVLDDLRGGRAGWNALHYATEAPLPSRFYPRRYIKPIWPNLGTKVESANNHPENEIITTLKKNRAAVAAWLREQGLKVE